MRAYRHQQGGAAPSFSISGWDSKEDVGAFTLGDTSRTTPSPQAPRCP